MMSDRSFSKQSKEEGTSRSSSDLQWPPESQDFFGSIENMSMPESGNGSATGWLEIACASFFFFKVYNDVMYNFMIS